VSHYLPVVALREYFLCSRFDFSCNEVPSMPVSAATMAPPRMTGEMLTRERRRTRPTGKSVRFFGFQIIRLVQPSREKYCSFVFSKFVGLIAPFRADCRGALRVVTNVVRNAVDGKVLSDVQHVRGRRNRVVLAPQRLALTWR